VILSQKFLELKESVAPQKTLPNTFIEGLKAARWPGRCQTVNDPSFPPIVWFLDGAHTVESLECCIEWFVSPTATLGTASSGYDFSVYSTAKKYITNSRKPIRVLIFNCTNGRSGLSFLETVLAKTEAQLQLHGSKEDPHTFFDKAVFCANVTYADGNFKGGRMIFLLRWLVDSYATDTCRFLQT
jgi:folylpolyglutamate synthase